MGEGDDLDAKTFALALKQILYDDFRARTGRYPSQLEINNALVLSGLWEKGVRITLEGERLLS